MTRLLCILELHCMTMNVPVLLHSTMYSATDDTSATGTSKPSGAHEFTPGF